MMIIRTFQPGDEAAQVSIYNEAAAALPKFKPATLDEVRRRSRSKDFDPATRLFAVDNNRLLGYVAFHANGRVSYPWCRPGHETLAEPLFDKALAALRARGIPGAFAAYRGDWPRVNDFFLARGFRQVREMVNFALDLIDMPTPASRIHNLIGPLESRDIPSLAALGSGVLRLPKAELERYFFHNPYFKPEAVFVLRDQVGGTAVAAGLVIENSDYADPHQVDAAMPCFRLGAFGTEGMQTKRVNGLFSFLRGDDQGVNAAALDLTAYAYQRLLAAEVHTMAAQAPSDVPRLLHFYEHYFKRQGSFPVFELSL